MIMHDWRLLEAPAADIDKRPWKFHVKEATEVSFRIQATCPDSTNRDIWIEIRDGKRIVHAYDPEHDEPVNLRISRTGITIDSDRADELLKHYDLKRYEAMESFARQMAAMPLPEEEWKAAGYADVEDYVTDLGDDRLCSEYNTFMDMVRTARQFMT